MKLRRTTAVTLTAGTVGALALALLVHPGQAHAALLDFLPADPTNIGKDDIVQVIMNLIQWALAFASAVGATFIVINGYQYILSAGNPEKIEKAKMGLTWSVGGFILAISSYAIVYLTARTLGYKHPGSLQNHQPGSLPGTVPPILGGIANILFTFAGAIAVGFIIVGGYRYVTSQGNQELVEKAKKTLLYAIIGLIVIFISAVLFNLVASAVGSPDRVN